MVFTSQQERVSDVAPETDKQPDAPEVKSETGTHSSPPPQADTQPDAQPEPPYSAFTPEQKLWIIVIAAWAGWFSTASSFVYFPAIPFMASQMHVSVERINLTVTSYLVASGVFPTVTGSIADRYGRRVTLIASISAYVVVNIALAVQSSFPALFVLRMLQSAAISGGYSITYGVVSDLASQAERGGYTGAVAIFLNTPPSVAPLISGLLLLRWTWPSIFWFLTVASGVTLIVTALLLPETGRNVVGNGSLRASPWSTPLIQSLCPKETRSPQQLHDDKLPAKGQAKFNPVSAILLLRDRGTLIASACFGIYYTVQSCLQASLSTIFVQTYGVTGLVAGLIYIPFGMGCSAAAVVAGRIIDRDYRVVAAKQGIAVNRESGDSLTGLQIERARLRSCKFAVIICAPLIIGYGWALQVETNIAVPLILQFLIGFFNQLLYTCLNTLLLDYWPGLGASVQAANNLVRCELAAAGLAALDPLLMRLGPGWCFVVFAGLHFVTFVGFLLLEARGLSWRERKE